MYSCIACSTIAEALAFSKSPLIISQYLGRNPQAVVQLQKLSRALRIPIFTSCPSTVCIPFSEANYIGVSYSGKIPLLPEADVVLVIDADVPWIPSVCRPGDNARVFVIDCDPLKDRMGMGIANVDAEMICKADSEVALSQILDEVVGANPEIDLDARQQRQKKIQETRTEWLQSLDQAEKRSVGDTSTITVPQLLGVLHNKIVQWTLGLDLKVLVLNEAITAYPHVWSHMRVDTPGGMLCSGSSSLGWALGAGVGAKLTRKYDLVVAIVGDGSFMFGAPSSVYWMSRRYQAVRFLDFFCLVLCNNSFANHQPFLTVILNNGGWTVRLDVS
jgi:thiamine pyrophosphate-dependent acetolactate synthase large subunit-like protein